MSTALMATRPRHRPGGWTPAQLGTLSLWLDADDATTITLSTGVSQWDDKSGNARHVSQATGANQPVRAVNVQNGRAVLQFDGTNHFLSGGDVLDIGSGNISVIAAYRNAATSYVLSKTDGAVNVNGEWATFSSDSRVRFGNLEVRTTQASQTNARKIHAWVLDRSASSTLHMNGNLIEQDTGSPFPNSDTLNTTAPLLVGSADNLATTRMNGDIYEIVVSLTALSTDDRQRVEGYLAHKWGLTVDLPSGHPYKSVAP